MGIRGFERRLERLVEGVFARAFKSGLRPVELGRRLVREMDDHRSVGVRGGTRRAQRLHRLALGQRPRAVRGRAGQPRRASWPTPPASTPATRATGSWARSRSSCVADERLHTGALRRSSAAMAEGDGRRRAPGRSCCPPASASPSASRSSPSAACPSRNLVLADPNVSRHHAEIRPQGDGFVLVDLGSTNGTRVNGVRVEHAGPRRTATRSAFGTTRCASRRRDGTPHRCPTVPDQLLNLLKLFLLAAALPLLPPRAAGGVGRGQPARRLVEAAAKPQARPRRQARRRPGRKHGPPVLRLVAPARAEGPHLPARRGDHGRPGRRLPGHPRRHLRVASSTPGSSSATARSSSRTSAPPTAPTSTARRSPARW